MTKYPPIVQKQAYRNRKLLDLAHDVDNCLFQIPGVCAGYTGGCVPAHSNNLEDGKAAGHKAQDFRQVASCVQCHYEYDSGKKFTKQEKRDFFERGWQRTIAYYFLKGWITVEK